MPRRLETNAHARRWRRCEQKKAPDAGAANSALALKYDDPAKSTPVTESQLLAPRRWDDRKNDLWAVFNRVQENLVKGGLNGRTANGRNQRTRPVQGIDQNLRLNRALWLLAEGMRQLKA